MDSSVIQYDERESCKGFSKRKSFPEKVLRRLVFLRSNCFSQLRISSGRIIEKSIYINSVKCGHSKYYTYSSTFANIIQRSVTIIKLTKRLYQSFLAPNASPLVWDFERRYYKESFKTETNLESPFRRGGRRQWRMLDLSSDYRRRGWTPGRYPCLLCFSLAHRTRRPNLTFSSHIGRDVARFGAQVQRRFFFWKKHLQRKY